MNASDKISCGILERYVGFFHIIKKKNKNNGTNLTLPVIRYPNASWRVTAPSAHTLQLSSSRTCFTPDPYLLSALRSLMLASIRFTSFSFKPTNHINSQRGPEEDNSSGSVSGKIHRLPALAERARTSSKVLVGRIPLSKPKKKKRHL